jgi:hypothetical protein|tara:strand:+ start:473 stop:685 length:213 start_codon:yes stop_codon:yes gene_type:complete
MDFFTIQNLALLITAVVFTGYGYWVGKQSHVEDIIESTIDSLINDGYVKTEGHGDTLEIIKWQKWCDEND